ncbi:MAG: type III pantothenate kinase, partial [Acholeplasmatales bacterium]|nr:type III pantothenate kinase [Acholeplasmatales bacterium]
MILLVDVGNSNILFGVSDKENIITSYRIRTFTDKTADEYYLIMKPFLDSYQIEDVIISSVVPVVTSALKKAFSKHLGIDALMLAPGVKTGVQLKVDDPKTVGTDIICDVASVVEKYNEVIVIDLGTATKYIHVKNKTFLGVAIAPGVAISMKALVSNAALLPNIELVCPKTVIGTNTISCMQSGVIYGAASEVDGMVTRIKEEIGNPDCKVIATGGLSKLIIPLCKNKIEVDADLT